MAPYRLDCGFEPLSHRLPLKGGVMKGKRAQEVFESQLYALKLLKTPSCGWPPITPPLRGSRSRPRRLRWGVRIGADGQTFPTSRFSRYVEEGFVSYPLSPRRPFDNLRDRRLRDRA